MIKFTLLLGAFAAKCPFGYGSDSTQEHSFVAVSNAAEILYPSQVLTCASGATQQTTEMTPDSYKDLAVGVIDIYHAEAGLSKKDFAGCIVRLAGHDFMDFRYKQENGVGKNVPSSGGSDGCVNFADPDNAGLQTCLAGTGLQQLYSSVCGTVSLADFIVIAAEATMTAAATDYNAADPWAKGTMGHQFLKRFRWGRVTRDQCPETGLMPNPEGGCGSLATVFEDHIYRLNEKRKAMQAKKKSKMMGWSWTMTAAISGAHSIGSAKLENSGYKGAWSSPDQQGIFNNDYYKSMLAKGWGPVLAVEGNPEKTQWRRIDNAGPDEMMLTTDLCLAYDNNLEHAECMKFNKNRKRG